MVRAMLRWACALGALLLLLEIGAFGILYRAGALRPEPYADTYRESRCLKENAFNVGPKTRSAKEIGLLLAKLPHPFFGFIVNAGRLAPGQEPTTVGPGYRRTERYRALLGESRPEEAFRIAILGASVAESWGHHLQSHPEFTERLRAGIPALRNREIEILNWAVGGSRQPAQFAIATYYQELVDVTVNLDGYSEIAVIQHPRFPIEYPIFADALYSPDGPWNLFQLRLAEQACAAMSRWGVDVPLLRFSNLYYLLWYNMALRTTGAALTVAARPDESVDDVFSVEERTKLYGAYYSKYTRLQHHALAASGVDSYYFLQPNQWVPNSKPFSDLERQTAFNYAGHEAVTAGYAELRQQVRQLASEGVAAFDLTQIFAEAEETLYVDSCCHVNERGNQRMAEAAAELIIRHRTTTESPQDSIDP